MKIPEITSPEPVKLPSHFTKEAKNALKKTIDLSIDGTKNIFEFAKNAVFQSVKGLKDVDPKTAMTFLAIATAAILGMNSEVDKDNKSDKDKTDNIRTQSEVTKPKTTLASLKSKVEASKNKPQKKETGTETAIIDTGKNNTVPKTSLKKPKLRSEYTKIPSGKKFKDAEPILFNEIQSQIPRPLLGTPEAIIMAAELCRDFYVIGAHCSAWVANVYEVAGAKGRSRKFFDRMTKYKGRDCGTLHLLHEKAAEFIQKGKTNNIQEADKMAVNYLQETLKPGAHLVTCNSNKYSPWGAHSEIFMGWVNKKECIAKVAGYGGGNRRPYIKNKPLGPGNKKSRIVRAYNIKKSKKHQNTAIA